MKATERTIEGFFLIGNPFSNVTFANVSLTNLISKKGHLPLFSQFSSFGFSPLQMTVWHADETFEVTLGLIRVNIALQLSQQDPTTSIDPPLQEF